MAPELVKSQDGIQLLSEHKLEVDGFKCDVYSAAIVFAEITQPKVVPYAGLRTMQILQAVVNEGLRPSLPEDISDQLAQVRRGNNR